MKVSEAICSAIPCAASGAAPNQPIMTLVPVNIPVSATSVSPIGRPSPNSARAAAGSGRQNRWNRWNTRASGSRADSHASAASCSQVTARLASAAPVTPSSGAPRWPKISTQFSPAFTGSPANVTHSTMLARPSAARKLLSAMPPSVAGIAQAMTRVQSCASAAICGSCPSATRIGPDQISSGATRAAWAAESHSAMRVARRTCTSSPCARAVAMTPRTPIA